ncbi:hypothetical protein LMOSLCC7179_0517 [Listeria monocytogenes SLCC7179]|nr:hypothetical protein LMOSLCC7179_0517 [Listeria monocytogenes SLCC7179]
MKMIFIIVTKVIISKTGRIDKVKYNTKNFYV